MHIVLATGIFPPDIGGPATYSTKLAEEFLKLGHRVTVITYGKMLTIEHEQLKILFVSKSGNVFSRWMRYAKALREYGADADRVIAFSSVSTGIPLMFARLKKPKKILRLGGDFFWERYTDTGGMQSLRDWYASPFGIWRIINSCFMEAILRSFDSIVYSTEFQQSIHASAYGGLPPSTVIENAKPFAAPLSNPNPSPHHPFRLLFMGRFVRFKNLPTLLQAMLSLPGVTLTMVGAGPIEQSLRSRSTMLGLDDRVTFRAPVSGDEKRRLFAEHDLLLLPSVTEISPNVALEAAAAGLPVLLTEETGLRSSAKIRLRPLRTAEHIATAVRECIDRYDFSSDDVPVRTYADVAQDWMILLLSL